MFNFINSDIIGYSLLISIILIIVLAIWNIRLEIKTKRLMRGKSGTSLEESFIGMQKELDSLENFKKNLENHLKIIEKRLSRSIQGVEGVSFDAFDGMHSGGKSFALAFLNEKGDGIIVSSLHARDRVSLFTKKIRSFKADQELSEEESVALTEAKKSCIL